MSYELSEEQLMLQQTVRQVMERNIKPTVKEYDEKEEFPWEQLEHLKSIGVMGITVPEEYGGMRADYLTSVIVTEEVAKVSGSMAITVILQNGGIPRVIAQEASEQQKKKYLNKIAKGEILLGAGISEPDAGSDLHNIKTTAVPYKDGFIINGAKCFTSNCGVAELYQVFAKTTQGIGVKGISAFLIEKGTKGFTFGRLEKKMGMRSNPTGELIFNDCFVPAEAMLGKEGEGFLKIMNTLNAERILNSTVTLGLAQGAFDIAIKYVQQRKAFNRPIVEFQGLQWMLADMAIKLDAARLLIYRAATLVDQGKPFIAEASMAKVFTNEAALEIITNAMQLMGGYGYIRDYDVERMYRDARGMLFGGGTPQIQRNNISRLILKKAGYKKIPKIQP